MNNLFYNFKDCQSDIKSLIHVISLLGNSLIGLELGVFRAESSCTILQNCSNIKTLYGIDAYKPYSDFLKTPYDNTPAYSIDLKTIEYIRLTAKHNIEFSGFKEKFVLIEKNSTDALPDFEDSSLDFIFIDTYMTQEHAKEELTNWYPKLKYNGLFSGHDWNNEVISKEVINFRREKNIKSQLSAFDDCWCWIKNE